MEVAMTPRERAAVEANGAVFLEAWRTRAIDLCKRRGWSLKWDARLANHMLEAAELSEAIRGKGGNAVEEAGDLLFTALAMIPEGIEMSAVLEINDVKIDRLMTAPPYAGEDAPQQAHDWDDTGGSSDYTFCRRCRVRWVDLADIYASCHPEEPAGGPCKDGAQGSRGEWYCRIHKCGDPDGGCLAPEEPAGEEHHCDSPTCQRRPPAAQSESEPVAPKLTHRFMECPLGTPIYCTFCNGSEYKGGDKCHRPSTNAEGSFFGNREQWRPLRPCGQPKAAHVRKEEA